MSEIKEETPKKTTIYLKKEPNNGFSSTENFLSEQIESIINDSVLDENLQQPMSHVNIENTVKAITEFLVICHRTNSLGTCKATMCRQLQLALQGRPQPMDALDIGHYETYYRLQFTVYEKLYKENALYALFCMPTLNNLAIHYLEQQESPEKARKCLNNVLKFHEEFTRDDQKLPEKLKNGDPAWAEKRLKDCQNIVEYFYTTSLIICSRYYFLKENFRMSMKVGLRYLRRMASIHAKKLKDSEWIETATILATTCLHSRALSQAIYLVNSSIWCCEKMEDDVKREECTNCVRMAKINNTKRRFIKQLRTEVDLSVLRIAVWILEEAYKRSKPEKYEKLELDEKVEVFEHVKEAKEPCGLPENLFLDQKDFANLLKKARNLMKLNKKHLLKTSEWTEFQSRVHKIAQMRI